MKSNAKIELSLDDLKSILFNEDGTLNLSVKNHIVQEFSKRYLKGVFDQQSKDYITRELKDLFYKTNSNNWKYDITPEFKTMLLNIIEESKIMSEVKTKIETTMSKETEKYLDTKLLYIIDRVINSDKVRNQIENKVMSIVDSIGECKIKNMLLDIFNTKKTNK
jgi:molybdopterin/thiamine biosynthesis adenylyltransferase